jgi:hypothetical protein
MGAISAARAPASRGCASGRRPPAGWPAPARLARSREEHCGNCRGAGSDRRCGSFRPPARRLQQDQGGRPGCRAGALGLSVICGLVFGGRPGEAAIRPRALPPSALRDPRTRKTQNQTQHASKERPGITGSSSRTHRYARPPETVARRSTGLSNPTPKNRPCHRTHRRSPTQAARGSPPHPAREKLPAVMINTSQRNRRPADETREEPPGTETPGQRHKMCSRDRTRTYNLPVNSRTLCRLSYAGSTRIRVAHLRRARDAHGPWQPCLSEPGPMSTLA